MKRRQAMAKIAGGLAFMAAAVMPFGLARLLAPGLARAERNILRPPGALKSEPAFNAACIGCGLCGEICPPKCIKFHKRDGAGAHNTPYIDAADVACTLCGKCMEVCPTDALTVTDIRKVDMGFAFIDQRACYPWVDRGICGACVSACPLDAKAIGFIMWNQYRPVIRDGCVGCGVCVEVCPHPSQPIWITQRPAEKNPTPSSKKAA